ncbi:uncharacterized protein LOC118195074 isoform X2 [Stegodyphus dumicola]|uniref:uncharacterized protein LOC118195074 isoform X2 n=1 Tax=Stegodyphus dumicola TaxID=202533 RepID=UPI0015B2F9EC|nr:uncharacterized protein LOC118195074 isoform X2 [Stegodyphus dumicola]
MDEDLPSKHFPEAHFPEISHPKTILHEWNKDKSSSTDPDRSHENPCQGEMFPDYHKYILGKDVLSQNLPSSTCSHSNWENNACQKNTHDTNIECSVLRDECGNVTYQNEMPLLTQNKSLLESSIPEQKFLKKKRRTKTQNCVECDIHSPESAAGEESFQHFINVTDSSNSVIVKRGNYAEEKDKVSLACKKTQDIFSPRKIRTANHMRSIEIQMSPIKSRIAASFGEDSVEHKDESMEVDLEDGVGSDLNDPEEPSTAEEDFDSPQEVNQYSEIEESTAIGSDSLLNEGGTDADGNYSSSAGEECSEGIGKTADATKSSEQGTVSGSNENKQEVVDKQNNLETEGNGISCNRTESFSLSGAVSVNNEEKSRSINSTRNGKEDKIVTNENEALPVSDSNVVNPSESYEIQKEEYRTSEGNAKVAVIGSANNKCEFNSIINSQENIASENNNIYASDDKGKSEETETAVFEEKGTQISDGENSCEQLKKDNNIRDCILSSKEDKNVTKYLETNFEASLDDNDGIVNVASAEFGENIEEPYSKFGTLVKREDLRDVRKHSEVSEREFSEEKREKKQLESEIFCSINEDNVHESRAYPESDISSFKKSNDILNEKEEVISDISPKLKCEVRAEFSENVEDIRLNNEGMLDISDVNLQKENTLKSKEEVGRISSHFNDLNVENTYTNEIKQSYDKMKDYETKNTPFQISEDSKNYEKFETFDNLCTSMGSTSPDLKHDLTVSHETDEVTLSTPNGEKINLIADEENMRIDESAAPNDLYAIIQNNVPETDTEAKGNVLNVIAQQSTIRSFSRNDGEEIHNQQLHKVEKLNTSDLKVALSDSSHVNENKIIAQKEAAMLKIKPDASPELDNNFSSQNVKLSIQEYSINEVTHSEERNSTTNEFSISYVEGTVNRQIPKMQAKVIKSVILDSELSARNPSLCSLENCTQKENTSAKSIPDEKAAQNVYDTSKVVSPRKGIKVEEDEIETAISSVQFYEEISDSNGIIEHEVEIEMVGKNVFESGTKNECMPRTDDFELKSSETDEHKGQDNSVYPNLESPSRITGVEKIAKNISSPRKRMKRRKLPRSRSAPHKDGVSSAPQKTQDSKGGKGNQSEKLAPRSSSSTTTRTPSTTEKSGNSETGMER